MSKIDRIKISAEFHIAGNGLWLAAECPVTPDENPIEQFIHARDVLMDSFKALNPGAEFSVNPEWDYKDFIKPIPETQVDNGNSPEERRMIMLAIDNETRLRDENGDGGLLQWQYAVKKYPDLVDSFNVKVSELLIRQKIKS